jgi:prepilin-type N-terminal cleavage/methylation domain-containing protein/prepilin-type processing-associated H-X9-DG protein
MKLVSSTALEEPKPVGGGLCAAFSLIELLLVMALLVLLVTLYWSPAGGSRQRALQTACQRNLEKLNIALEIFANENGDRFPVVPPARTSGEALDVLVPRYTSDTALFICPASKDSAPAAGESLQKKKISYAYYMGRSKTNAQQVLLTDAQVDTLPKGAGEFVFSGDGKPPGNNHAKNGGNLMFCDGHVQSSPPRAAVPLPVAAGEVLLNP